MDELKGGVAGGSILQGVFKVGMEVEIRPGIITRDPTTGHCTCRPLRSRIVSLLAEQNQLQFAVPGGLIGVGTLVDPALCRADRLLGMVMSAVGKGPSIYTEIKAEGMSISLVTSKAGMTDHRVLPSIMPAALPDLPPSPLPLYITPSPHPHYTAYQQSSSCAVCSVSKQTTRKKPKSRNCSWARRCLSISAPPRPAGVSWRSRAAMSPFNLPHRRARRRAKRLRCRGGLRGIGG